jgi:hypothetical protein
MPEYFPENNTPIWTDTEVRSLQKIVGAIEGLSGSGSGSIIGSFPVDAFGRLKTSNPFTLFDSSHRYRDNGLWSTYTSGTASSTFNESQGLVDLNIGSANGDELIRETTKVFSYQPGKSLLFMSTLVMNPAKTNLRQRVGYFGDDNGVYLELYGNAVSFVERSLVTGSPTETIVSQADWNGDKLDGTGTSGITLDLTKAQILWSDIEWLGVGTIRMGFVINGQFITCHSFHHANLISSTYITTASLPLRYEIKNVGTPSPATSSTLKQICSTVISGGGYELNGAQQAVGTPIQTPRTLATAGTFYPIVALRLKSLQNTPASSVDRLDAIIVLTAACIMPDTSAGNPNLNWRLVQSAVTVAGSWLDAGSDSSVEYNLTATSVSGGRVLASGYVASSNQGISSVDILKEALFKSQLERNGLTGATFELVLEVAGSANNAKVYGSLDWEEVSR